MAKNALTVIKKWTVYYNIINVKNFHSMLVLIKQVLIIIKLMYLINMKLKRCYILYSFVLQCLTQFYLFF